MSVCLAPNNGPFRGLFLYVYIPRELVVGKEIAEANSRC
jgi:hypothetical protein